MQDTKNLYYQKSKELENMNQTRKSLLIDI